MPRPLLGLVAVVTVSALLVSGCGDSGADPVTPPALSGAACRAGGLPVKTAGRLTFATAKPAPTPWFVDDNPNNGQGYESAVAYAVADRLGFPAAAVDWIVVPRASAVAAGEKDFDLDIDQVVITTERRQVVDFSPTYYTLPQAVVTVEGSPIADADTLAGLRRARLGAVAGSRGATAVREQIGPTATPVGYADAEAAARALAHGTIDGLVVDLPTAFGLASTALPDGQIVGRLPVPAGGADQFGLVLSQGSRLTGCVGEAVRALASDGTLAELRTQWLDDDVARLLR